MVYFSSMANKLYLSLATCIDLGLIPKEFPFSTPMPPQQAPGVTPCNTTPRLTYRGPADQTPPTRISLPHARLHLLREMTKLGARRRRPHPPLEQPQNQIAVDHKPLLKLFGDRSLEDISNTCLRNLKEKTLRYRFRMVYIPGVRNHTSDALSHHPSGTCQPARLELQDDHHSSATTCLPASSTPTSRVGDISTHSRPNDDDSLATALCAAVSYAPITWEDLQITTAADTNLRNLSDVSEDRLPDARHNLLVGIRDYFPFIHDLSLVNSVICRGERIIIPAQLQQTCLNALHAAHQGTSGMTARAQTSIFWPGI